MSGSSSIPSISTLSEMEEEFERLVMGAATGENGASQAEVEALMVRLLNTD